MKEFDVLLSKQIENLQSEGKGEYTRFETLYECFIQPNEETFRQTYKANCCLENAVEYEACTLDFIPIADQEYVVLDREAGRFCGTFAVKPYEADGDARKTFTSILIADYGDVREIVPIILQKSWRNVYIVLNEGLRKFTSFYKLEDFPTVFPSNVKIFATTADMHRYFLENHDAYLPRKVFSRKSEKYDAVIKEIHDIRVRSGIPSNNAFLSVCVPSFNRGHRALKAVEYALTTCYDAEIEIVLVNTGSTNCTEGYQQIKNMRDSRLRYYELEKNGGFHESYCSALSRASGHFAMMLSDEDSVAVEKLNDVFEYLNEHCTEGVTTFNAIFDASPVVEYLIRKLEVCEKGLQGVTWAFDWTRHISGTCFNINYMKESGIFEKVEEYRENLFFFYYPHCVFSFLMGYQYPTSNSGMEGWRYGKPEVDITEIDWPVNFVLWPEWRIKQCYDAMKLLGDILCGSELDEMFHYQINTTFSLISLLFKEAPGKVKSYRWIDIWMQHYQSCLEVLQDLAEKFGDISSVKSQMDKSFLYWQICKREQRLRTPEENLRSSLQAQVAKYYHEKGVPFEEMDFGKMEEDLESWITNFLAERS